MVIPIVTYIKINHNKPNCICCKTLRNNEDNIFCSQHRREWFIYWSTKYGMVNASSELILDELNFFIKDIRDMYSS